MAATPATTGRFLTQAEIAAALPPCAPPADPLLHARARMRALGLWHDLQSMGRNFTIGCVALEITQRCNLDCSLCYLSDNSEAVHDLPLEEVFRRIDLIRAHYGAHANVQVTGGDPTLRERGELVAIVRRVAERGMRPSLFTNGIRATRALLAELAAAGLVDVAFHVDTTQGRRGATDEASLNAVRRDYIARARGLGLSVMFNTTVHPANLREVPMLARFFLDHADGVRLASFQLGADTGRGTTTVGTPVTPATVTDALRAGAGVPINFDGFGAGHRDCNRYTMLLVAGGHACDLLGDERLYAEIMEAVAGHPLDRRRPWRSVATVARACLTRPALAARAARAAFRTAWRLRAGLVAGRLRVRKFSFFVHGFMGARCLEADRVAACSFTVMTGEGPLSMCLHNAKRDAFILRPSRTEDGRWWDPLTGRQTDASPPPRVVRRTRRTARGRVRLEVGP